MSNQVNGNSGYVDLRKIRSMVLEYPVDGTITAHNLAIAADGAYSGGDIVRYFSKHEDLQTRVGIRMERVWIEKSDRVVIFFRRTG